MRDTDELPPFSPDESCAMAHDNCDPLRHYRDRFHIPPGRGGASSVYFCGNSLGLAPRAVEAAMRSELADWASLGVEGHFKNRDGWFTYHEAFRGPLARLAGAHEHEVVAMNSLTTNLHLLMVSFFRPSAARHRIVIDGPCFPSDLYAVRSQLRFHGIPESEGLLWLTPRAGEHVVRTQDALDLIEREGDSIALVLLAGVNYVTGQSQEMGAITEAARRKGCVVGWDLAHAIGNIPLSLHGWGADFAVWCSYKYLNGGPGAVGGCFVHERHTRPAGGEAGRTTPRFEGWWGNDPATRFSMGGEFEPVASADAWQLSNPPILAMLPLRVSLAIFDEVGLARLRTKSMRLTAYLERLVAPIGGLRIITPADPASRGAQLSILVPSRAGEIHKRLTSAGVICDLRPPDVIRLAPAPLYNGYHDCWVASRALRGALAQGAGAVLS